MDPNVKLDPRHKLPGSIVVPIGNSVTVLRCKGCLRMFTEWEIKVAHVCPYCNHNKFMGGRPGVLWMFRWWLLNFFQSWRVHGPEGWGYERAKRRALEE